MSRPDILHVFVALNLAAVALWLHNDDQLTMLSWSIAIVCLVLYYYIDQYTLSEVDL